MFFPKRNFLSFLITPRLLIKIRLYILLIIPNDGTREKISKNKFMIYIVDLFKIISLSFHQVFIVSVFYLLVDIFFLFEFFKVI